jgi:3-oxoacyl-[acyl-carrier-protein] synthase III
VLVTKARGLQRKGAEHFPFYLNDIDYGIPHQITVGVIKRNIKATNRFLREKIPFRLLYNVERVGNTTTTSYFIILHEFLLNNTIRKDHNLLFVGGGSGMVISHATYTMDDLPERYISKFGSA